MRKHNRFGCSYDFDIDTGEVIELGNERGFECYKGNPLKKLEKSVKKRVKKLGNSVENIANGVTLGLTNELGITDAPSNPLKSLVSGVTYGEADKLLGINKKKHIAPPAPGVKADIEANLFDSQADSLKRLTEIANAQEDRSAEQYDLWKKNYLGIEKGLPKLTGITNLANKNATDNYVASSNKNADTLTGSSRYNTMAMNKSLDDITKKHNTALTNFSSNATSRLNGHADAFNAKLGSMSNAYNSEIMGYANNMGKADQDILERIKANAYAGVDTGFDNANKQLQADLARRGLTGSGIFARSLGDLAGQRAMDYSARGAKAYNDTISASDSRRRDKINTRGQGFNAQLDAAKSGYGATSSALANAIAQERAALQSTQANSIESLVSRFNNLQADRQLEYNANQNNASDIFKAKTAVANQRLGNNISLAQLGRGMQTNSQNYLGQAGNSFGKNAQISGSTALGLSGQANNLSIAQLGADAQRDAGKGAMGGSLIGAGATIGAAALSDERLKENIEYVGDFYGYSFYTWDWNEKGLEIADPNQPTFGVLAQEARLINPQSVHRADDGYYRVDYNMIMGGAL